MFEPAALFGNISAYVMNDPLLLFSQGGLVSLALLVLFLLFYTLRDVFHRTHSFLYQFFCILLVALLPIVGFLLYLLIRPARTIRERETEQMIRDLWEQSHPGDAVVEPETAEGNVPGGSQTTPSSDTPSLPSV